MAASRLPGKKKLAALALAPALAPALARWETLDQGLRMPERGLEP